jgi:nitroreductase
MDAIKAIHGRRSIRSYRPDPVPRDLIEDLVWDAVQAPTPPVSGSAPWAFCAFEGVPRIAALGLRAKHHARDHGQGGRRAPWAEDPAFKVFWDAPALVVICHQSDNAEAALDCCRAGQNLLVAAHARGLGACWVGAPLPWLTRPEVGTELGMPAGYVPNVAIVLGFASEAPAGSPRPRPEIHWR